MPNQTAPEPTEEPIALTRGFDYLLAPTSLDEFVSAYYERRPFLVSRQSPHYYDEFITIAGINDFLGCADIRHPGIRLARAGDELDPSSYTYSLTQYPGGLVDGIVDKETLFQRFNDGYTIILTAHERQSRGMFHLRHLVERTFLAGVQANVYITPRETQCFAKHWDNHDVFVLQFEGSKEWSIYDRRDPPPGRNEYYAADESVDVPPRMTVILRAGDLLYLPKGYEHEVRSMDALSGHVTLGMTVHNYADLLRLILDGIDESPEFRDSLPMSFGDFGIDAPAFADRIASFFSRVDLPAAVRRLYEQYRNNRRADASDRLQDYLRLPALDDSTPLRKKTSLFYDSDFSSDGVELHFNHKTLRFSASAEASIRHILAADVFSLSSLPSAGDRREIVTTLITEGFLTIGNRS